MIAILALVLIIAVFAVPIAWRLVHGRRRARRLTRTEKIWLRVCAIATLLFSALLIVNDLFWSWRDVTALMSFVNLTIRTP
jgi:threonine/homoserine/homoserine lactone efflux protein